MNDKVKYFLVASLYAVSITALLLLHYELLQYMTIQEKNIKSIPEEGPLWEGLSTTLSNDIRNSMTNG